MFSYSRYLVSHLRDDPSGMAQQATDVDKSSFNNRSLYYVYYIHMHISGKGIYLTADWRLNQTHIRNKR